MFKLQLPGSELRTRPFCFTCKVETGSLKTCSRCGHVKYCSTNCQKTDFQDHKGFCKVIKKTSDDMKKIELMLGQVDGANANFNFFQWHVQHTVNHMQLRCSLVNHLFYLGIRSRDQSILNAALSYYSNVDLTYNQPMSYMLPFLYAYLNQDLLAFKFMKHRMDTFKNKLWTFEESEIYEWADFDSIHDVVIAAIIKCRIVQQSRFTKAGFETFLEVIEGHRLLYSRPAIEKIQKYLGILDAATFNRQKDHFVNYIKQIKKSNLIFLKSLINPEPLLAIKNIGLNDRTKEGSLTEASGLLRLAGPLLQENDYAMKMIMKKVGKNPTYPTTGKPTRVM